MNKFARGLKNTVVFELFSNSRLHRHFCENATFSDKIESTGIPSGGS